MSQLIVIKLKTLPCSTVHLKKTNLIKQPNEISKIKMLKSKNRILY